MVLLKSTVSVLNELEEFFVDIDPYNIEKITKDMLKRVTSRGDQIHKSAIGSVEIACWDIILKKVGVLLLTRRLEYHEFIRG